METDLRDEDQVDFPRIKKETLKTTTGSEHGAPKVNLEKLSTDSLRKYCKFYSIADGLDPYSSREQMLDAVTRHFVSQRPLDEKKVIPEFVRAAARQITRTKD